MTKIYPANSKHLAIFLLIVTIFAFNTNALASDTLQRGEVILATGEVWVNSLSTGERTPIRRGHPIYEGDQLESAEGAATLKMIDQAIVSLHPHSQLHIRDYNTDTGNIRIELNQGRIDTQTGESSKANKDGYRLNTPFAALGIRGTEYSIVLNDGQLDVYVHAGEIILSPFSQEHGCLPDAFGPCQNPLSASLEANSGTWLQLKEGGNIRRIRGTPQFLDTELTYNGAAELPRDTLYDALGNPINPDNSLRQSLQDPLLNLTDKEVLPTYPNLPEDQITSGFQPEPRTAFSTDLSSITLSEEAYRNLLRRITLKSYSYNTLGRTQLYNFEASFFPVRSTSLWVDTNNQRLWGQDNSVSSLLESRYWSEGRNLWIALPSNLQQMGANNTAWFNQVRENTVDLWRLPLDSQAIFFTPMESETKQENTLRFTNVWTQPIAKTSAAFSDNSNTSNHTAWSILDLTIKPGEDFNLRLTQNDETFSLKGRADSSGVIYGSNDQFRTRGHIHNNSIILIVENINTGQLSMNGLASVGRGDDVNTEWSQRSNGNVNWGHWSNFAEISEEQHQLIKEYSGDIAINRHFALATPEQSNLPTQGQFNFALSGYEAVYVNGDMLLPAEVSNANLNVDFNQQTLSTGFDLTAPGLAQMHRFEAQGQFDQHGRLEAFNPNTQAQAQGYIGNQGNQASFIFELPLDQNKYYSGTTHWQR